MQTIKYYLDDQYQVFFSSTTDLQYQLIQADTKFGFDDVDVTSITVSEIDELLLSNRISIDEGAKHQIENLLATMPSIQQFDTILENQSAKSIAFGFKEFCIVLDKKGMWLLIKNFTDFQANVMFDIIELISKKHDLFVVDREQGIVVQSSNKINLINYFSN